jgi:transcriptional regulator with XRE-family HTH domain
MTKLGGLPNGYKDLRLASGLSQSQVADELGVTKAYVSMVENGKVNISLELQRRLNKIYAKAVKRAG